MGSTKQPMKKLTIQDIIKVVAVVAAALVMVIGVAAVVEHMPKNNDRKPVVTQDKPITTPATLATEDELVTTPVTEPEPETTAPTTPEPETTLETTTAAPETTPAPTTTTEATTTKATTTAKKTEPTTKATEPTTKATEATTKKTEATTEKEEANDDYTANGYNNNIKNVVFLGTDRYDVSEKTFYRTGGQSDTILIISMDLKKKEYFIVNVNRNLVVPIQTYDKYGGSLGIQEQQICLAHAYGDGSKISGRNTLLSLNALLGDDFKWLGFIEMPMNAIGTINDMFGGVKVDIVDDFGSYDPSLVKGTTVLLEGYHAEKYLRGRMRMVGDTTNPARMRRQMHYMDRLRDKIKNEMSAKQLVSIYEDCLDLLLSDMSKAEITKWITQAYDYEFKGYYSIIGEEGPDIIGASAYYVVQDELDDIKKLYYK